MRTQDRDAEVGAPTVPPLETVRHCPECDALTPHRRRLSPVAVTGLLAVPVGGAWCVLRADALALAAASALALVALVSQTGV